MFGERLRTAIKKCGYTQEEFAKLLNTSRTLVNQWINGKTPSTTSLKKISNILNLPINYFFDEDKKEKDFFIDKETENEILSMRLLNEQNKTIKETVKRLETEIDFLKSRMKNLEKIVIIK